MAWTALTFAFASKLTSVKMTQLQANFTAIAGQQAGAPHIGKQATAGNFLEYADPITGIGNQVTAGVGTPLDAVNAEVARVIKVSRPGTYTVRTALRQGANGDVMGIIHVNSLSVGAENTVSTTTMTYFNENILVSSAQIAAGGLIQLYTAREDVFASYHYAKLAVMCNEPVLFGSEYTFSSDWS